MFGDRHFCTFLPPTGLFHDSPSLEYRTAPPVPARPVVTNVGACRVDLTWTPPGDEFHHMTVTGYKILWFQPEFRTRVSNLTVGTRLPAQNQPA